MQTYDRAAVSPPRFLTGDQGKSGRASLADFFAADENRQAQQTFSIAALPDVESSLDDGLDTLFHSKCAFCETKIFTRSYRFRPPMEALPLATSTRSHLYYVWLAWAWENIYPICMGCMPPQEGFFPVNGDRCPIPSAARVMDYVNSQSGLWGADLPQERNLLLDPCSDSRWHEHFRVTTAGQMFAQSARGEATLLHFRLDRPQLVEERGLRLSDYREELCGKGGPPDEKLFNFLDMEFGGAWCLLLQQAARLLGFKATSRSDALARVFHRLLASADGAARLRAALDHLKSDLAARPALNQRRPQPRQSSSRLLSIKLSNFKALEGLEVTLPTTPITATRMTRTAHGSAPSLETIELAPSLLVLGENAAGKSSFLEAVALALCDTSAREELAVDPGRFVLNAEFMGGHELPERQSAVVELAFSGEVHSRLSISRSGFDPSWSHNAAAPPVFAYGAFRQYLEKDRRYSPAKHIRSLFHSDFILSNPEKWLLSLDEVTFSLVIRTLRRILVVGQEASAAERPDGSELGVIKRRDGRCCVAFEHTAPDGEIVRTESPLSVVSSGFRTVLAMACDILQGLMDPRVHQGFETFDLARAVVLIDEIEAHLHPRWKIQVMRGLRLALPSVTFIATTHDPLCIRGMGNGEVLVLQRVASPLAEKRTELPVIVEPLTSLPRIEQLTVEQLLTSDLFQLLSADAPEMEATLARMGDLLARKEAGSELSAAEHDQLSQFQAEVAGSLPVGSSPVQRIVERSVADFLRERRTAPAKRLEDLKASTRASIVAALRTL